MNQSFHILREARATITTTGIKELASNTGIGTNSLTNIINVSSNALTEIRYVVHKTDTSSQHRIGRVLGHFSRRYIHEYHTEVLEHQRAVKACHYLFSLLALCSNNYTVRTHKVLDGSTFFQKLRVAGHIERNINTSFVQFFLNSGLDFLGRTNRHCRFCDKNGVFIDVLAKLACYRQHIFQVSRAILIRRCAYGTENHLNIIQNLSKISSELQSFKAHIALYQFFQSWLIDGHYTIF